MIEILKKRFWNWFIILLITFVILIFPVCAICQNSTKNTSDDKKKIITTTTMLYDAVQHLLGNVDAEESKDYKKIANILCDKPLMGVGIDPHNYKTKLSDRMKIKTADLVIINGLHLEAKMIEAFELLKTNDQLWKAGEESLTEKDKIKEENSQDCDPHIWFDIDLWKKVVLKLKDKLKSIIVKQTDKAKLEENCKLFLGSLDKLTKCINKEMISLKEEIEKKNNKLIIVTTHDAFSYWQKFSKYKGIDFELKSIQGVSTQTEASMKDIINLAEELTSNNVKTIFTESSMPKDYLQSLKETTDKLRLKKGLKPIKIPSDVELYSDSLGSDDKQEEIEGSKYKHSTYVGAFLNNVKVIKGNLL
ncbi:MAG: zinc ABC transporter substrate-binding protein [Phytoplasma sp.]|uniref:metal ABC transporter solute-binding protein, Zn/Mn family n=1 Tax=Phytoplasma sp. TaxID=2155 RepID=UPI002B407290|nr:zinc ABC transporter substrate-binding protein [Phytoplasma sp.]WRH06614.1 MAG: zinc ABC transporter substrate-binding protein [Phytoplasma sp.]